MFSPDASHHAGRPLDRAAALRDSNNGTNPRRRQRTSSADSLNVRQTNPKRRKRSALAENTFLPPVDNDDATNTRRDAHRQANGSTSTRSIGRRGANDHAKQNEEEEKEREEEQERQQHRLGNGNAESISKGLDTDALSSATMNLDAGSLAVRNKPARKDKRTRGTFDDGVELTRTGNYVLTRDRGIPHELQDVLGSEPWHARMLPNLGFAVALTHSQAIVWRHGPTRLATHGSGVHVIDLPPPHSSGYDTLPVGTLVHDAGAGELALLVLMPGGSIAYYESVAAAASRERASAQVFEVLHGSVGGFFSSEHAVHVVEAEADGFLLSTTMGRLFHLSVRDSQGRPRITTQQLRMPSHEKVGIFGSIRNAITGGGYQHVAAILTLPSRHKSSRNALVTTVKGDVQLWAIARHGAKTVQQVWDLKETIEAACKGLSKTLGEQAPRLLDATLLPTGPKDTDGQLNLMCLACFPEAESDKYFLVGLSVRNGGVIDVNHVHQIHSYNGPETTPDLSGRQAKPTLVVPEPAHTAFAVFDTKIVIVSLFKVDDTPDSQLHAEAHDLAENYEECLFFNRKLPYHSAGCAARAANDDRTDKAVCDIMIHGFGHIKLTTMPNSPDASKIDRKSNLVQSRLEQVVFFGAMKDNFLNFREPALWENVPIEDIEAATSRIIDSILDSSSTHVPSIMPSMDQQLKLRAQAISDLNRFVQQWSLSVVQCWRLLWAGEKLTAARAILTLYNQALAVRTNSEQKILLEELIDMVPESDKVENEYDRGEYDCVRHFLTIDVARLNVLVAWMQMSLDVLVDEGKIPKESQEYTEVMAPLTVEAADLLIATLETAWNFRETHAEAFGLGKEVVENGIYQRSYADLPGEPWTATEPTCLRIKYLVKITKDMALRLDNMDSSEMPFDDEMIGKLATQAAKVADCAMRAFEEHCRWVETSNDMEVKAKSAQWRTVYHATRLEILESLVEMGSHLPAAELAEKYNDMDALALVVSKIQEQGDDWSTQADPEDREQGENILAEVRMRTDKYFDLYGRSWAHAFFGRQVKKGDAARMLALLPHRQNFLTEYLRSKKESDKRFNRLAWINEVRGERNFATAGDDLMAAARFEHRLWAKQVGFALAKLSHFAAIETGQLQEKDAQHSNRKCVQYMHITEVQQRLYEYMCPLLHGALDSEAELQLATKSLGAYVAGKPALAQNLRSMLHELVMRRAIHAEELIEALTIMSPSDQLTDETGFVQDRFYWALWLLHVVKLEEAVPERAALHQRLIWRRVILQDDWVSLNRTEAKSDEDVMQDVRGTALYNTLRAGFEDGLLDEHPPLELRSLHPAGETIAQLREASFYHDQDDAFLARLAQDHAAEEAALEEIFSKGRLEMWYSGVIAAARDDVRGERDAYSKLRAFKEAERQAQLQYELSGEGREDRSFTTESQTSEQQQTSETQETHMSMDGMILDGTAADLQGADGAKISLSNGNAKRNANGGTNGVHMDDAKENRPFKQAAGETEKSAARSPKKTKKITGPAAGVTKKKTVRARKGSEADIAKVAS